MNDLLLYKADRIAQRWEVPMLDPIPIVGHATPRDWKGTAPGTKAAPGRNHPEVGRWLTEKYLEQLVETKEHSNVAADPMIGTGGLWLRADPKRVHRLYGTECEESLLPLTYKNTAHLAREVDCVDARAWLPRCRSTLTPILADLVLFSPPFIQNHSAGNTENQKRIRRENNLHSMQEFGSDPRNIGSMKRPPTYWSAMLAVYIQTSLMLKRSGVGAIILRNYIREGKEIDEVHKHIFAMRMAGLKVIGAHPREIRPTGYVEKSWARRKVPKELRVYTDIEWTIMVRR